MCSRLRLPCFFVHDLFASTFHRGKSCRHEQEVAEAVQIDCRSVLDQRSTGLSDMNQSRGGEVHGRDEHANNKPRGARFVHALEEQHDVLRGGKQFLPRANELRTSHRTEE